MQPYFFPYLGYFGLIRRCDRFVLLDVVQFIRHGWIERNRILKPEGGWQYIQVPLTKQPRETTIKEMKIRIDEPWQARILRQLAHYKSRAPYYKKVVDFLENAFSYRTDSITDLDAHLLGETCRYIGIPFNKEVFSEMHLAIEEVCAPDEWALNICKSLAADTYVNAPGGVEFFDRRKYDGAGITLEFLKVNLKPYNQRRQSFEEALSILDVMMFNTPQEILTMLDDYRVLPSVLSAPIDRFMPPSQITTRAGTASLEDYSAPSV